MEWDAAAAHARSWDRAVAISEGIDRFCSASPWSFAAGDSFPDVAPPILARVANGWCGLRAAEGESGRILVGMDPIWGFASPLVGPPGAAAAALELRLRIDDADLVLITGQDPEGPMVQAIAARFARSHELFLGPEQERLQADLSEGFDAWFARRSGRFRQRMRRLERDAIEAGIHIEERSAEHADEVLARCLAVEAASWKGRDGTGLAEPSLAEFYERMAARLGRADQLRAAFALVGEEPVGFVLSGVGGGVHRGLQLSHREDVATFGIGHLLQLHQIRRAAEEHVGVYDLGMDMAYKHRFADRTVTTAAIVLRRR